MSDSRQERLRKLVKRSISTPTTPEDPDGLEGIPAAASDQTPPVTARIQSTPLAKTDQEREVCLRAHEKIEGGEDLDDEEMFHYEAIVLPTERPALLVQGGTYETPPSPWERFGTDEFKAPIMNAIAGIGRVELSGPTARPFAGTGFVVGPNLVMTNRHVAKLFARGVGKEARFITGFGAAIDLACEKGRERGPQKRATRVVMIHPYWDMALLEIEDLPADALQLNPLEPDACIDRPVALVGFPMPDPRNPADVQDRVFGSDYGFKRMMPGRVLGRTTHKRGNRSVLAHDSSTLGGCSGAAVVDATTGDVLGLHFAGEYLVANYAVPAFELSRDGEVRDAGVTFSAGAAETPNPWQSFWDGPGAPETEAPRKELSATSKPGGTSIKITIPIQITIRGPDASD